MSELLTIGIYFLGIMQGVTYGYIFWAPSTPFKQGFVDGITLKRLWSRK